MQHLTCGPKGQFMRCKLRAKQAPHTFSHAKAFAIAGPLLMLFCVLPMPPATNAGPADEIIELKLLGSTARLGVLYNYANSQFLPESLWEESLIAASRVIIPLPHSQFSIIGGNTINQKAWGLDVEASLVVNVLAGMVEIKGFGQYFDVRKKTSSHEIVRYYDFRTNHSEQLSMALLSQPQYKEHIQKGVKETAEATHVVVGITYGARAVFAFQRDVEASENARKIYGKLELSVSKFPVFTLKGKAEANLTDLEKNRTEKYTVTFNGDYAIDEIPDTYENAIKTYASLAEKFVPVPIAVTLYPLKKLGKDTDDILTEITNNLIDQVKRKFQEIENLQEDLNTLYEALVHERQKIVDVFASYKEKLDVFGQLLGSFKINFQLRLKEILPKARVTNNMQELSQLLKDISNSPFKYGSLKGWLDAKQAEFSVLQAYFSPLRSIHLADDQRFVEFSTDFRRRTRVSLELKVETEAKYDEFLKKMEHYLVEVRKTKNTKETRDANDIEQTSSSNEMREAARTTQNAVAVVRTSRDADSDKTCPAQSENEYRPDVIDTWYQNTNLQGRMRTKAGQLIKFWEANQDHLESFLFFAHGGHVNVTDADDKPDCHLTMFHEEEAFYDTSLLSSPKGIRRNEPEDKNPIAVVLKDPKTVSVSWDHPEHIPDGNEDDLHYIVYNRSSLAPSDGKGPTERNFTKRFIGSEKSILIEFQDHLSESVEVMVQAVGDFGFSPITEVLQIFYGKQRYCAVLDDKFSLQNYNGSVLGIVGSFVVTEEYGDLVLRQPEDFKQVKLIPFPEGGPGGINPPLDVLDTGNKSMYILGKGHKNLYLYDMRKIDDPSDASKIVALPEKLSDAQHQPDWQFVRTTNSSNTSVSILCKTCRSRDLLRHEFELITQHTNGTVDTITISLGSNGSMGTGFTTGRHQAAYSPERAANFDYFKGPRLYAVARQSLGERHQVIFNTSADHPQLNEPWLPFVPDPYADVDPQKQGVNLFTNLERFADGKALRLIKTYDSIEVDELGNILVLRVLFIANSGIRSCKAVPELLLFNAIGQFVANLTLALPPQATQTAACKELREMNKNPITEYALATHSFFTKNGSVVFFKEHKNSTRREVFKLHYLDIVYQ